MGTANIPKAITNIPIPDQPPITKEPTKVNPKKSWLYLWLVLCFLL